MMLRPRTLTAAVGTGLSRVKFLLSAMARWGWMLGILLPSTHLAADALGTQRVHKPPRTEGCTHIYKVNGVKAGPVGRANALKSSEILR